MNAQPLAVPPNATVAAVSKIPEKKQPYQKPIQEDAVKNTAPPEPPRQTRADAPGGALVNILA